MTYRIPAEYGQLTHVLSLDGDADPMVITLGLGPNIVDDAYAANAVAICAAAFSSNVMPEMPDTYVHMRTELAYHVTGEADDDPFHVVIDIENETGGSAIAALPQNSAYLCHKRTAVGGRQGRGRFYLPGVREGEVNDAGVVSVGQLVAINGALTGYHVDVQTGSGGVTDLELYLFHNLAEGEIIADLPTLITGLDCDSTIATQRRRLRR